MQIIGGGGARPPVPPPPIPTALENQLQNDLTEFYVLPCHFSYTRFEHFFKSLDSRTFDVLKHVSRFPRPKITHKS